MIRCGNHGTEKVYHNSTSEVRACFSAPATTALPETTPVLDDAEFARVVAGVHDMMNEGILPKRSYTVADAKRDLEIAAAKSHLPRPQAAPVAVAERQISPRGREIPETFGGSPKQYDYLCGLATEKGVDPATLAEIASVREASAKITELQGMAKVLAPKEYVVDSDGQGVALPRRTVTEVANDLATTDGIFRNPETGEIFKGQFNRAQGDGRRLYFKRLLVDGNANISLTNRPAHTPDLEWAYAGAAQRAGVKAAWILSREDAAAFGALYGVCVRCHRDLTREESIERAMGPICAGKQGW